jgi:hypothetical protein
MAVENRLNLAPKLPGAEEGAADLSVRDRETCRPRIAIAQPNLVRYGDGRARAVPEQRSAVLVRACSARTDLDLGGVTCRELNRS